MQLSDLRFSLRWQPTETCFLLTTNAGLTLRLLPFHGEQGAVALLTTCCHRTAYWGKPNGAAKEEVELQRCRGCQRPTRTETVEAVVTRLGQGEDVLQQWAEPYFDPISGVVAGGLIEAKATEVAAMLRETETCSTGEAYRRVLAIL